MLIFSFLTLITQMAGCQTKTYEEKLESLYSHSVPLISTRDLMDAQSQQKPMVLLDTRTTEEHAVSAIAGARLVDFDNFSEKDIADIPRHAEIVVYCSVGYRSEKIGEKMLAMGYTNVKNLYGGIFQWKNDGLDVVGKNGVATDSVHTYNKSWSKWLLKGIKVY
ncbi:MAG: rhodanese-like domain-containing protein [Cyclobacteriaceae bacterium]|nr:rhodanese-like domain-containing protein [Cyclobacteriaceae bacterium]